MRDQVTCKFIDKHKYLGKIEFDWGALDKKGNLGYFSSASFGPIPEIYESQPDCEPGKFFEDVMACPVVCEATQVSSFDGDMSEWVEIAKRGIYAFDWCSESETYKIVASPSEPLTVDRIEQNLIPEFSAVKLDGSFASDQEYEF